jgi:uncharacterized protein YacL
MILNIIRIIFIVLVAAVAIAYLSVTLQTSGAIIWPYVVMVSGVVLALAVITLDFLVRRKNLSAMAGLFFGILIGILVSLALGYLIEQVFLIFLPGENFNTFLPFITGVKLLVGLIACYLCVSLILQTKDDFRFVIPYVEFSRATRGARPFILDTSVIIDGRIADVAGTGIFESRLIVPRFVLNELQTVADSSDKLKRGRGRRGLDVLHKLQALPRVELHVWDGTFAHREALEGVDQKLIALAQQENGRLVTNDYNLNKIAGINNIDVVNLNDLANAVKPAVLPGEALRVRIIKPGETSGQGVGYLEDGTMVVVDGARDRVGQEIHLQVTNVVQTSAGRMIFGRMDNAVGAAADHNDS